MNCHLAKLTTLVLFVLGKLGVRKSLLCANLSTVKQPLRAKSLLSTDCCCNSAILGSLDKLRIDLLTYHTHLCN